MLIRELSLNMADNDYAVVVGVNRYPNEPLSDLDGPENDALEFKDYLTSPAGGAVPDQNIRLILSRNFPSPGSGLSARPMTAEVDSAFEDIIVGLPSQAGARRLYIFLAGHGIAARDDGPGLEEAALLMANAGYQRMGHHVPGRKYANWFRAAALFQEVVLLMDCCRDDYPRASVRRTPWDNIVRQDAVEVHWVYGFATKWSRKARERALGGQGQVKGVFSHAVLTVLKSGRMTGCQLRDCVYNYLPRLLQESEYQEPEFDVDPAHDLVFSEAAPPARLPVRVSFSSPMIGRQVELLDFSFNRQVFPATGQPLELTLELGKYRLRDVAQPTRYQDFHVLGGGTIDVEF
ncbi:MAG: caspase family protein [Chloroflexi bacterium]|nr:caspase family protein [Chloroflexota bacterium]